ncbi:BlaI/MecI/CopY family transcriptional regulator [Thiohalorhabdus sp. Cl-TMA]|uniref:BlaI/MecI/CopY family transcriptional regulator n=1 Tax=Thiohalorhabdus methylotrophus TaxID=3242694 RepID=A0ABV4TTF7_9GAMM
MTNLRLGELEVAVLEDLWARGADHAKAVHGRLGGQRGISLNTIQSTLERLYRKDLLHRSKEGHAYIYRPALEREELLARLIEGATAPVAGEEGADTLLTAFVDFAAEKDEAALDRLEALIARKRAQGAKDPDGS